MKFIERILLLALVIVAAAIVINGFVEHAKPDEKDAAPAVEETQAPTDEAPIEAPKAPEKKLPDNMEEAIFIAKDDSSVKKSLADFQAPLPKEQYDKIIEIFLSKHQADAAQNEDGELHFPSTLALKSFDGKSAKEILESEKKSN